MSTFLTHRKKRWYADARRLLEKYWSIPGNVALGIAVGCLCRYVFFMRMDAYRTPDQIALLALIALILLFTVIGVGPFVAYYLVFRRRLEGNELLYAVIIPFFCALVVTDIVPNVVGGTQLISSSRAILTEWMSLP